VSASPSICISNSEIFNRFSLSLVLEGLVGKPEEKRPPQRPRHRREDNVIMDLREIVWEVD